MLAVLYAVLVGRDDRSPCLWIVGRDDRSPCLWRIDPTGHFWKCDATAIGRGSNAAAEAHLMNVLLEKDVKDFFLVLSQLVDPTSPLYRP
jgi:hypothetical protein